MCHSRLVIIHPETLPMLKKISLIALLSVSLLAGSCSNSIGPEDDTIASTNINFSLPEASHVKLWIENAYQTRVATLVDEERAAGSHSVVFEMVDSKGKKLPGGLYTLRLKTASDTSSRTILIP